ncbi:hypothetical protein ASD04_00160 [Devosia sp. Root436]|uniref:hypothetical protein n=1 Tax=Devosia sp. Root436 TaxID=1736537 RepID=UPI0006F98D86|nr:hypothetical protein [Devosia sp. Root436]KQX42423.1 hypothetical protein ASD04_00160 [Devosia sp. Root436]
MEKIDARLWRFMYWLETDSQDDAVKGARPGIGKVFVDDAVARGWVIRVDDRKLDITLAGRSFVRREVANGRPPPALYRGQS